MVVRELNPKNPEEITLVAARMRQTLIEVLGEEKGTALYSMDWLIERVKWHLDADKTTAKVFLIEGADAQVLGHAIARLEYDDDKIPYGYFSTVFVDPAYRKQGLADKLVSHVEEWLTTMSVSRIVYNTAENHEVLIRLFQRHGFEIVARQSEMVQLAKTVDAM